MPASQTAPGPTDAAAHEPGLSALALGTLALVRQLVADVLGLVALETRLAGLSLGGMVLSALAAAFAVMAFWLMLQAGLIVAISRAGVDVLWLLAGFTLLNGLTAVVLLLLIRRLSRNLTFRATAEALRGGSANEPAETRNSD